MNTTKKNSTEATKDGECRHYLARGALVWGPLYTTGVSGMAYAIAPAISGDAPAYSEVLLNSLVVCPTLGAAGGYIRWKLIREKPADATGSKCSKNRTIIHWFKSDRRSGRKKAA